MVESKGTELAVLSGCMVSLNWQGIVSITVGILAGLYYATRIYKEWFCGQSEE